MMVPAPVIQAPMIPIVSNATATKILLSNLDSKVTDADMKELFGPVGPLRSARVNYDSSGKSLGTAEISFSRKGDANKAFEKYNGFALDGKIMKMLVVNEQPTSVPVTQRLQSPVPVMYATGPIAAAPQRYNSNGMGMGNSRFNSNIGPITRGQRRESMNSSQGRNNVNDSRNPINKKTSQKGRDGKKSNTTTPTKKNAGVQKVKAPKREKPKTTEELDKEMDEFMKQSDSK